MVYPVGDGGGPDTVQLGLEAAELLALAAC